MTDYATLEQTAKQMRIDMIRMTKHTGNTGAHIGGALSLAEIMTVLYHSVMKYHPDDPTWEDRDRLILSKGHGVMAQYAAMKSVGILDEKELMTFKDDEGRLYAHPTLDMKLGIEFASGSLGQGLSQGVGTALALRKKGNNHSHVFVIVGDGECNEGQIWEAAMSAAHYELNNMTIIIDQNHLQYDGETETVLRLGNLEKKWDSFGFNTMVVDGHDVKQLCSTLFNRKRSSQPRAILAQTVKGKGISFMENNLLWHNGRLTDAQYQQAMKELGADI